MILFIVTLNTLENTSLFNRSEIMENECTVCLKVFSYKSNLTRHVKNIHGDRSKKYIRGKSLSIDFPRQGEMDKFDVPRQSGGVNGDYDVQSTSQTNFENVGDQVDVDSQDADCSTADRDASHSDGYYGDSEFSDSSDVDDPRQSGRTKFENVDNQVDVGSEDDDQ